MADLTTSANIDSLLAAADYAAARALLGVSGDMTKAVYDPQNVGKISGHAGPSVGGILTLDGGVGGAGGSVNTSGGAGAGSNGGTITMVGGGLDSKPAGNLTTSDDGGNIDTSASGGDINTSAGGSVNTSSGGGSLNTTGTGSLELGVAGTRTTVIGSATSDRAINFPDAAGALALTGDVADQINIMLGSAASLPALMTSASITPAADGTYALPTSITISKGIITAIS